MAFSRQANDAVAFSAKIMIIIYNYYKSFPCSGEHVRQGLDTRGGYKQARHTHTHTLTHRQCSYV